MKKLDVLYTIDNKYIDMCLGSILSLIKNGNIDNLRIHIITSDFNIEDYRKVEKVLNKYNCEYYFYDIKSFNIERFGIPKWRGTQIANARLFFQEIMGASLSNVENLLYLDSDLIVVSDLTGLDSFRDNGVSAVKDSCYKSYMDKLGLSKYFNSGVILFNTEVWTKDNYQERIIEFLEKNTRELQYPDQDILNCSLDSDISDLPINYNLGADAYLFSDRFQKFYYTRRSNLQSEEIEIARRDPKILHSTGILGIKPWTDNNINPFNEVFMRYILEANPDFKKYDLDKIRKVLTMYPFAFKMMVLAKTYMPEKTSDFARKLIHK